MVDNFQLLKADNFATPIASGTTDLYLLNKSTNQFLSAGASWGTHSIVDNAGHELTATLNDGFYTLKTQQISNKYLGSDLYMDNGTAGKWLFLETSSGSGEYYMTLDGVNYLAANSAGTDLVTVTEVSDAATWSIIAKADRVSALSAATKASPTDATFMINDQNFGRNNASSGWTRTSGTADYTGKAGAEENFNWQKWNGAVDYNQSLSGLPNGKYQMKAQGFYRPGANNTASTAQNAVIYAGINSTPLALVSSPHTEAADNDHGFTTANTNETTTYYVPNSQSDASKAFSAGYYENTLNDIIVTDGALTIGVRNDGTVGNQWTVVDNFRLYYYGPTLQNEAEAIANKAEMTAGKWYYYDVEVAGEYKLGFANLANVVYTTDGATLVEDLPTVTTSFGSDVQLLAVGRYYFKSASAQTFSVAPNVMEYHVGTATSSVAEGSYQQSLTTVSLTFANAATNDEDASLSLGNGTVKLLDANSAELATATLSIAGNVVTATFSNVSLALGSAYSLAISANVVGYAAGSTYNEAQTITFHTPLIADGFYYAKTADNRYLSRGANYNTQAIADSYGIPLSVSTNSEGITEFIFIDNWFHLFDANNHSLYTDNNTAVSFALEATDGGYYIVNKNATSTSSYNYKLYVDDSDGSRVKSSDENATVWTFESTATNAHKNQMQALKDAQAAAAATAAGIEGITTQAGMKSYLASQYYETEQTITGTGGTIKESYQQGASSALAGGALEIFKETVSGLTPGLYRLSVNAFERITWPNDVYNAGGAPGLTYVYANDQKVQLASLFDYPSDTQLNSSDVTYDGKYYPQNTDGAQAAFNAGSYENVVYVNVTADEGAETGSITFGINKPHRYANDGSRGAWVCYNGFKLDLLLSKSTILNEITAVLATVPEGKMNNDVQSTLNTKKSAAEAASVSNTGDELKTILAELNDAIATANASIAAYRNAKVALDGMKNVLDGTNFYTTEAYEAYAYETKLAAYNEGTLANDVASALINPENTTGWRAANDIDDLLMSAWDETVENWVSYHVNTWSNEGDSDGSAFKVPFIEYWTGDDDALAAKTMTATLSGLENGLYKVSAWVRVRAKNGATATDATGITMNVNGGTDVDVTEGTQVGESQFQLKQYTAEGLVKDGALNLNFVVAGDNTVSWLSFKNVTYTKVRDLTAEEQAVVPTAIAVKQGEDVVTEIVLDATTNSVTLTPAYTPADASEGYVAWSTSDAGVATVTDGGVVTGVTPGTATITVTSTLNQQVSASVTVTVRYPESTVAETYFVNNGAERTVYTLGENLIKNGSFEYPDGFYGWTNGSDWTTKITSDKFSVKTDAEGNKYLCGTSNDGASGTGSLGRYWEIEEEATYIFSYRIKKEGSSLNNLQWIRAALTNTLGQDDKSTEKPYYPSSLTSEWQTETYVIANTDNHKYFQMRFRFFNNEKGLDNFYFGKVTKIETVGNVDYATAAIPTANIGTGAFQFSQAAIDEAKALVQGTATVEDVENAYTALTTINEPAEGQLFNIVNTSAGYNHAGKAVTFKSAMGADLTANTTSMGWTENPGSIYPQGVKFTAVDGKKNVYKLSYTRADGETVYVSTGKTSGLGSATTQIRPTTDAAKALEVRVEATATDNVWYLWNTEASLRLGANGANDQGLFTGEANGYNYYDMKLQKAVSNEVALSIAAANQYGSLIVPFDVEIPSGVVAYAINTTSGNTLTLEEQTSIKANTPYVVFAESGATATLAGLGAAYNDASYTTGLLTGTYTDIDAPNGSYILQNHSGKVGFYRVDTSVVTPKVRANRAYLTDNAGARGSFLFEDSDVVTAIGAVKALTDGEAQVFDANGIRQERLVKGLNIVRTKDGRTSKVMVK